MIACLTLATGGAGVLTSPMTSSANAVERGKARPAIRVSVTSILLIAKRSREQRLKCRPRYAAMLTMVKLNFRFSLTDERFVIDSKLDRSVKSYLSAPKTLFVWCNKPSDSFYRRANLHCLFEKLECCSTLRHSKSHLAQNPPFIVKPETGGGLLKNPVLCDATMPESSLPIYSTSYPVH